MKVRLIRRFDSGKLPDGTVIKRNQVIEVSDEVGRVLVKTGFVQTKEPLTVLPVKPVVEAPVSPVAPVAPAAPAAPEVPFVPAPVESKLEAMKRKLAGKKKE